MKFSEVELKQIIKGKAIGDQYPYSTRSEELIENNIKQILANINRHTSLKAITDFNHYGSGYASYVDVFCYKKDGSSTVETKHGKELTGITLYISRLAPVAVYGSTERTINHDGSGGCNFLDGTFIDELPEVGHWNEELHQLKHQLQNHHIALLKKQEIILPLPFKADIPTILADKPYSIFDALFYWED